MNYKRLEIYLGWKCNYKCIYCIERRFIDKFSDEKIEEKVILKKLIKYKKL
jgi:wyosine [tRNA(Phe)-imidazoG37] synthetase (radical SAM superfamily)